MQAAVDQIREIGSLTLHTHRQASDKAAAIADQWQLESRLEDELAALRQLFDSARLTVEAIENTRSLMHTEEVSDATRHQSNFSKRWLNWKITTENSSFPMCVA